MCVERQNLHNNKILTCAESFRILDATFFFDSHLTSSKRIQIASHLMKIIKIAICYRDFSKKTTFRIIWPSIWSLNEVLNWWIAFFLWLIAFWSKDSSLFKIKTHRFIEIETHRFLKWELIALLKWELIAFWNENSSFFSLTHFDHHITFYNTYDHRWVSISHTSDDIQGNFSICMKNFENDLLIDFHTDEKISLHVIKCMQNRHSTMIVDIIESYVMIEKNQREKTMKFHLKKQ